MSLYLVDTSAWILAFSNRPPAPLKQTLGQALEEDRVQTCGVIVAELLQGCRTQKEQGVIRDHFASLHYLSWPEPSWVALGEMSAELRRHGLTIPIMDLMITWLAINQGSIVLHRDKHFDLMARHLPISAEKI